MIRAITLTILFFILFAGCLLGSDGQVSWPMAWAVLGIYWASKVVGLAFLDPELIKERAAPGPGVDRGDMVVAALGYLLLYPGTFVIAGLDAIRFGPAVPVPLFVRMTA